MKRREAIKLVSLASLSAPLSKLVAAYPSSQPKITSSEDWRAFRKKHYSVSSEFINLENGYFGVQPNSVLEAYRKNIELINTRSSKYMREVYYQKDIPEIKKQLGAITGASPDELLITRNATESMNILIQGISLNKGDEVLLQHHDYHSMIETFKMLEERKGIKLKYVDVPLLPKTQDEVVQAYQDAITPRTKCILVTHLTHLTGQILPVAEISALAKERNIDVLVDAAHSFSQIDYTFPQLQSDFIGVNLHKWFGNPLGVGLLYIKKDRIRDIQPLYGDVKLDEDNIQKLGHYGTPAAPVVMTLKAAIAFHNSVTIKKKQSRLKELQLYWAEEAKKMDRVDIVTPLESGMSCGIASFAIDGHSATEIVDRLKNEFNIFTVIRKLNNQTVVRVTPNLYNLENELDRLLDGISTIAKS
ncbi:aminotransferase class V-fold PLP-dependent enzyme [Flagellimonas allohymeniacidonis]|uniref:Aminotransferase class V-fold PLP-dependent enzyme n=1 Tax=Flagellimonas allohymeniacidonis TaxID=2517819 RepID=A0A4Q8QDL7_9FLAO|nr:aminotransferase class V-fold PLP-dependent enzyme [Allomuricauda hymeniacidonis]TAI48495.1 aminotransferase class V-fold PLP-dependent enzyme [Allomuricauda hymeniacidonis]